MSTPTSPAGASARRTDTPPPILRTTVGETLYNLAREDGAIEELRYRKTDQRRNAGTEMMAKIVAATRRKQARAAARMGA